MKERARKLFTSFQEQVCSALEKFEPSARFKSDNWNRTDLSGEHGGGGDTRILKGEVFDSAGVNFSEVHGTLPEEMTERLLGEKAEVPFFAMGTSIVIHPNSPMIPTTHANFRYLEVGSKKWFGGGYDLTPYYLFEEDAAHYHSVSKATCDKHNPEYYERFKKWCDEYFYLPHRGEARGIGGLFFDYLGKDDPENLESIFSFVSDIAPTFTSAYTPIIERRQKEPWGESEKKWQLIRRGRYVEFNLIYDRGTLFGLKTGGRTESILMSLPPTVHWEYQYEPEASSREAELLEVLKNPRNWAS